MSDDGVKEFFDSNVEDYEAKHYKEGAYNFMTARQQRVLEFFDSLGMPKGSPVLDAGCGPGFLLLELARRGFAVQGVDLSPEMVRSAEARLRRLIPEGTYSFGVGSIEALPVPSSAFAAVCSTGVIEYLQDDTKVLPEMYRVLKPGGFLVLPVTNALSPVNCFETLIEGVKRTDWMRNSINRVLRAIGQGLLLPRRFPVRRHRPSTFRAALASAGFEIRDDAYFHFQPLPRPFERVAPRASAAIGKSMEKYGKSWIGPVAEGYVVLCRKPG
jgi:ubiquinone/menaquinone biosynthesis C-methylase UbiE